MEDGYNNVLLVKKKGAIWHTIYHHLPIVFQGFVQTPLVLDCTSVPYLWPKKVHKAKNSPGFKETR